MTSYTKYILYLTLLLCSSLLRGQPRDAGQMVVPKGWESEDSMRFGIFDFGTVHLDDYYFPSDWSDSIQGTFRHEFGHVPFNVTPGGKRKGINAYGGSGSCDEYSDLNYVAQFIKQRVYYPSPTSPIKFPFDNGYWWRYNDINILNDTSKAKWHNNTYDANDVSPYAEYKKNQSLVLEKFNSKRYNSGGDSLLVGSEGRVILGYSDNRLANEMLWTYDWYPYRDFATTCWKLTHGHDIDGCGRTEEIRFLPTTLTNKSTWSDLQDSIRVSVWWRSGDVVDPTPVTAVGANRVAAYSVTLEFNIDTDSIIMDSTNLSEDNAPLLRLQVLYKKGQDNDLLNPDGWSVLPFVPFNSGGTSGWHKCIDRTITKSTYADLEDSWRKEDRLENGTLAHSWKFKQLHIIIPADSMHVAMKRLIQHTEDVKGKYGGGKLTTPITTFKHQDSLVIEDNDKAEYKSGPDPKSIEKSHLLELRILSTYRATIRIRSLTWQDTIVDKFLFRRRATSDSTFALTPTGSGASHYDDSIRATINSWANQIPSGVTREMQLNDVMPAPYFSGLSSSVAGLLDWHLSRRGMALNVREQEWEGGLWSAHFRRERLSHDSIPPSVYENQVNIFMSNRYKHPWWDLISTDTNTIKKNKLALDIFPHDYVHAGHSITTIQKWPFAEQDSMVGLIIGHIDTVGDGLNAYRQYTDNIAVNMNIDYLANLRATARNALWHPKNKRMALQGAFQGWGIMYSRATKDKSQPWTWEFPMKDTLFKDNTPKFIYDNPRLAYDQRPSTPEENYALMYGALANGISGMTYPQCFDKPGPTGGAPGAFGFKVRSLSQHYPILTNSYNFGHRRTPWDTSKWTQPDLNDCDGNLPDYYIGYANTYRSTKKIMSRINQIYDTNGYNKSYPFKRLEWLNAYSANRGILTSSDTANRQTYLGSFIKAFCTTPVKRWERTTINGYKQYVDSTDGSGNLVPDSAHRTYVEVGMFRDNPNDTLKGYAAMVVNTRLWPSLRDAEDSIYYNQGLDSAKDRSRSTLGDIDTRKAWFKLDTIAFPPNFRSSYYVIRDVWHQDTTYLVHCDSGFGVYLKPGEARLLYIEKSIAIRTAPKAATDKAEFAFNNGRRVAEILHGRQSVVTYTRSGKLYVNYPGAGERFEGYNERSAGENIATGYELCIDSSGTCHRPSICAGMNDTAVAITYWSSEAGGRVKVAYQKKPYDAWQFATATDHIQDTTSDHSGVTPVIAPYAELITYFPIDSVPMPIFTDSIWLVAASYLDPATKASGIIGLRFKVTSTGIQYLNDAPDQFFHQDGIVHETERSAFPTITSRALSSARNDYPVRLAWQKGGRILYNRYSDIATTITKAVPKPEVISTGLQSLCYNFHPSIAMNCVKVKPATSIKGDDGSGQVTQGTSAPLPDTNIYMHDYVVWESKLVGKKWNSGTHFWPVLRSRYEKLEWQRFNPGKWNSFQVFRPKIDTSGFHWPVVSAGSRVDTFFNGSSYARNLKAYYERLRVAWYDEDVDSMEFVHYPNGIKRTIINEGGTHPSLPQPTYYIKRMSDSSMVQPSIAFMGLQKDASLNHVRITNGWFPMISTAKRALIFPSIQIVIKPDSVDMCPKSVAKIDIGPPTVIKTGGGTPQVNWKPTNPDDLGIFPNDWPLIPTNPVEFSSDTFRIAALDSIIVPRKVDSLDITSLRYGLKDSFDYFMQKILLKRHIDSSYVGTVDSIFISKGAALYPGSGIHPTFAKYEYPLGASTDSVFLSIEIIRGNTGNQLERGFTEFIQDDDITTTAFKQAPDEPAINVNEKEIPITMEIYPNPLSLSASVEVSTPHGVQTVIELYDINGKRVSILFNGLSSGKLTLTIDGNDLTNGIYFLRTQCGNSVVTKKVELIK